MAAQPQDDFAAKFQTAFPFGENPLQGSSDIGGFLPWREGGGGVEFPQVVLSAVLSLEWRVLSAMGLVDRITRHGADTRPDGVLTLFWESFNFRLSADALGAALLGLSDLCGAEVRAARSFEAEVAQLLRRASRRRISGWAAVLKAASARKGLPCTVVSDGHLILGQGARRRQMFRAAQRNAADAEPGNAAKFKDAASEYRLAVVAGRVIAAVACGPAEVTGDGRETVRELIAVLNAEPDRDGIRLSRVPIDAELRRHLAAQNLTPESVPERGRVVTLGAVGRIGACGVTRDVTEDVHPDVRHEAECVAREAGHGIAEVILATPDLARPLREAGGTILDVNGHPEPGLHMWPREGVPRDVAGAIVDQVFPDADAAFIPALVFAGDRATSAAARLAGKMLRGGGLRVGVSLKKEVYFDGQRQAPPSGGIKRAPAMLLCNPAVEAVVVALSLRRVVRHGLDLPRCDGVALSLAPDEDDALTAQGLDVLIRACVGPFSVDSRHPAARTVADRVGPQRVVLVAPSADDPGVAAHLGGGGSVVTRQWDAGGPRLRIAAAGRDPGGRAAGQPDERPRTGDRGRDARLRPDPRGGAADRALGRAQKPSARAISAAVSIPRALWPTSSAWTSCQLNGQPRRAAASRAAS